MLLGLCLATSALSPALAFGGYEVPNVLFSVWPNPTIGAKAFNQPTILRREKPKMVLADAELGQESIYFADKVCTHVAASYTRSR